MLIAVDFDGTITDGGQFPVTGNLREGCREVLNELSACGHTFILWTSREGDYFTEAVEFIRRNELPVILPQIQIGKIYADLYIDDKNIFCGGIDWKEIGEEIRRKEREIEGKKCTE